MATTVFFIPNTIGGTQKGGQLSIDPMSVPIRLLMMVNVRDMLLKKWAWANSFNNVQYRKFSFKKYI
jgi:hypothetical protein